MVVIELPKFCTQCFLLTSSPFAIVQQEGCYCVDRWVQRNKKDVEAGNTTASHLAVQYPADLAWFDVTCHVLDQKTLKQKQVCAATVWHHFYYPAHFSSA